MRGIEFYQKAVELEQRFGRGRLRVLNTIQTNGLELDERWCRLFRDHNFLVGISLDGIGKSMTDTAGTVQKAHL